MARKIEKMNTTAEQQAVLDTPINPTGVGEAPAIKALLSDEFSKMNDLDAAAVAIAVAKIVRGVLKEELDGTMGAMTAKIAEMEKTAKAWEADRLKFAQEMHDLAEKNRVTDREKVPNLEIKGAQLMEKARAEAQAEQMIRRAKIDDMVRTAPKVTMVHSGHPMVVRIGETKQTIVKPHEIHYEHLVFKLPPNEPVEIPRFIYEAYLKEQEMAKERNKLNDVLKDGKSHYGKAIQADPVVDPTYSQRIAETMNGIAIPQGGTNGK